MTIAVEQVYFTLDLSPEQYLAYYRGAAKNVMVRASDGRRIAFPAERLRPFVTRDGVRGRFVLTFDDEHRFQGLERVA